MIVGIGVDIVKVSRFQNWVSNPKLAARFFSEQELDVLHNDKKAAVQSLAGRFAAKEAFGKALGSGLKGLTLKDIGVVKNSLGRPELKLCGTALEKFNKSGADKIHLSISHESEFAIAYVVLENVSK